MLTETRLRSLDLLLGEAESFVELGTAAGFANPQSMSSGNFEGKHAWIGSNPVVDLTRLDYLSLGQNPVVRAIMKQNIDRFDISCPSSQMAVKTASTVRLEKAMTEFHRMGEDGDSTIFLSGYDANVNTIQALALRFNTAHLAPYVREMGMGIETRKIPTEFFVDGESHYSLEYGIKAARHQVGDKCVIHRFPTMNYDYLRNILEKSHQERGNVIRIIVTDSLSSMSGKIYDIRALCEIAEHYDCLVYVDEAHAIATMGTEGRGIASEMPNFERFKDRLIIMGTLTKAVAQLGGYVTVANKALGCFLRGCSPQYIFSAPLSPWMAETVVQVLELIKGEYGKHERDKLRLVSAYLRSQLLESDFDILGSESQIVPVLVGEDEKCVQTKELLEHNGFMPAVFLCPSVPKGKSIIRFSLCSDITFDEVDQIVSVMKQARTRLRF